MSTMFETILGTVIGSFVVGVGNLFHRYYLKQKIETTPDFWSKFWSTLAFIIGLLWPIGVMIHAYLKLPFDKTYVFTISFNIGLIVLTILLKFLSKLTALYYDLSKAYTMKTAVEVMKAIRGELPKDDSEYDQFREILAQEKKSNQEKESNNDGHT
jgi:uncharacterized membrane protein required for colicin V production